MISDLKLGKHFIILSTPESHCCVTIRTGVCIDFADFLHTCRFGAPVIDCCFYFLIHNGGGSDTGMKTPRRVKAKSIINAVGCESIGIRQCPVIRFLTLCGYQRKTIANNFVFLHRSRKLAQIGMPSATTMLLFR